MVQELDKDDKFLAGFLAAIFQLAPAGLKGSRPWLVQSLRVWPTGGTGKNIFRGYFAKNFKF